MKKFLPVLFFLGAAFVGRSQVILNEMVTTVGGANQFFELYNAGNGPVDISCYSIVSIGLNNQGKINRLNIIDFPDGSGSIIPAKGFYTAGKTATVFGKTMNYNWNATTQPTGASFRRYNVNANTNVVSQITTGTPPFDFLLETSGGNTKVGVFLFDGSRKDGSNNVTYVNGLVAFGNLENPVPDPALPGVPSSFSFATRPRFADPNSTCGTTFINWSQVTVSEYTVAASGNGQEHGYERYANGLCGAWHKITGGFTPTTKNPIGPVDASGSGALNTIENITCGGTQVAFTINTTPNVQYPVSVELYYDLNGDKYLDANEYQNKNITGITSLPFSGTFTVTQTTNVYLAYKTALGCVSKVQLVSAATAGAVTTTQVNICSKQIDFSIPTSTNEATTYGFPMQVQLYEDNGTLGIYDAGIDVAIGTGVSVASASNTVYPYSIPAANQGKQYLMVYTSPLTCYSKVAVPSAPAGTINTTQRNICGDLLAFTVTSLTANNYQSSHLFPMIVELHWDKNGDQQYDPTDADEAVVQATKTITEFSPDTDASITIPDASRRYVVVYKTAQECLSKTETPAAATGEPTTTQNYFCGKRVDYTVTGGTGDAALFSLPIQVNVYWDENGNGTLDEDISKPKYLLAQETITSFSGATHSLTLDKADQNKNVLIVYSTNHACLSKTSQLTTSTTGAVSAYGDITIDGSTNKAVVTYGLIGAAANAYPLELNVYEDKNQNKLIDANETAPVGTTQIDSDPSSGGVYPAYTADLKNPKSWAIVTAASTGEGCSSAFVAVTNPQSPLPVTFKSFTATRKGDSKVGLTWVTAMEKDNRGFYIQRSTGNSGWKEVGFVFSQAEGGNSSSELTYAFSDPNTNKGVSQYRILQVDLNGLGHYSGIRSVNGNGASGRLLLFPNPSTTGAVTLLFDAEGARDVVVADMAGRTVQQYRNITAGSLTLKNVANGFYTVQVRDNTAGTVATEKFIIKKR